MTTISEHTIDLSLIKRDSKVLDLGCRNFSFANAMLEHVDEIYCVDADPDVKTDDKRIHYMNAAVSGLNGIGEFVRYGNGTGNYLNRGEQKPMNCDTVNVNIYTLDKVCRAFDVWFWDVIKIDVEKSEVDIVNSLYRPAAKQLSIEWHMHCGVKEETVKQCFKKLERWYGLAFDDYSEKHGCGLNHWDTLWILKEIV